MAGIKRTEADKNFSKCIRESVGWVCERCHKQYPENSGALECAHFMTRGNWGTRFDKDNAAALCTGCHFYLDSHPYEKTEWFEGKLGEGLAQIIREKAKKPAYGIKKMKPEISKHYREELKRIKSLRAEGVTGKIEIVGYV